MQFCKISEANLITQAVYLRTVEEENSIVQFKENSKEFLSNAFYDSKDLIFVGSSKNKDFDIGPHIFCPLLILFS